MFKQDSQPKLWTEEGGGGKNKSWLRKAKQLGDKLFTTKYMSMKNKENDMPRQSSMPYFMQDKYQNLLIKYLKAHEMEFHIRTYFQVMNQK